MIRHILLIINNGMKCRILSNIETDLTKHKHDIVSSPSSQSISRRRKPGGGESPPGSTRSDQDFCGVQSGPCVSPQLFSPSDQQDLVDDDEEVMIFYNINPTVSPLSLIKLEQAWLYRLWFMEGRYSTRPDWEYLATVVRAPSGAVLSAPPVTTKCSPISIPQARLECNVTCY